MQVVDGSPATQIFFAIWEVIVLFFPKLWDFSLHFGRDLETARHPVGGGDQLQPQVLHRRPILPDQKHQCALADIRWSEFWEGDDVFSYHQGRG